jgi:hypothetical protein
VHPHYASAVRTKQVRAGRDTILGYVERASAVDIVAEFVWNSLDAEATAIEVTVAIGDLGAPEELVVTDNGSGMPPDRIEEFFLTHGESWKRTKRFSPELHRPLHGQLGRGRFLGYGIAERVRWRSTSPAESDYAEVEARGHREAPDQFVFDGPWPSQGPRGTTVEMALRQITGSRVSV